MPSLTIRVGHASGRFDSDAHEVAAYLAKNIRELRLDLLTTTESQQRGIWGIVRETVGERFGVAKKGEYLCVWRRSLFSRRERQSPAMLHLSHVLRLIGWRQMRAAVFPLQLHGPGLPVDVYASHAPTRRSSVRAWRRGHRRFGRRLRRRAERRPRLLQLIGEDANRDMHDPAERERLERLLGGPSIWTDSRPDRGSHDTRLIDVVSMVPGRLVRVKVIRSGVSPIHRPIGYDHRLVWAELRITWEAA